jgi:ankyrin repeat protein
MAKGEELFCAIAENDVQRLQQLISHDTSLASSRNPSGVSALMTAAYYRNAEMVELLRDAVEELDVFEATTVGASQRVRELLDDPTQKSAISADGFTPLHLAAFFNQFDIANQLVGRGADVTAVAENESRVQPLHSAAASGACQVVALLLESGADPNAQQQDGWTALQSAAKHGNLEMLEILLQNGADPDQQAENGESAIAMACNEEVRAKLAKFSRG